MNTSPDPTLSQKLIEPAYNLGEEIANGVTHGIGALLSVAGLTLMLAAAIQQTDALLITSSAIYGGSLILLFLMSTLYHSFQSPKVKNVFQLLDHCAIYLLIAGTYTPVLLVSMKGAWGYSLMAVIWTLAVGGIIFKLLYRDRFPKVSLTVYLLMGWLIIIAASEVYASVATGGLVLLVIGGLVYSAGTIFYVWERIPYNHAIWHLFVLGGSICHFFAIYSYVITPV